MERQPFLRCHNHTSCQAKALLAYSEQRLCGRTLLPASEASDESIRNQFLHFKGLRRIFAPTGGVPETPKHPPRNPAGASPGPGGSVNWQRCSFFINKEPQSDLNMVRLRLNNFLCQSRRRRVKAGESLFVPASSVPSRPDF